MMPIALVALIVTAVMTPSGGWARMSVRVGPAGPPKAGIDDDDFLFHLHGGCNPGGRASVGRPSFKITER